MSVTGVEAVVLEIRTMASDKTIRAALLTIYADTRERIFEKGLNSAGLPIGKLSTEPGYFNPKDFPNKSGFTGTGKPGKKGRPAKNKFADGRPHVTTFFGGGYAAAKKAAGRSVTPAAAAGMVDLYLTGDLKNSWLPENGQRDIQIAKNQYAFGFDADLEAKKAKWNEERFGTIFDPTQAEIDKLINLLSE